MVDKLRGFENDHRFHEFDILANAPITDQPSLEAPYTVREVDRRAMAQASKYGTLQLVLLTGSTGSPSYNIDTLNVKRIGQNNPITFSVFNANAIDKEEPRTILEPILNAIELTLGQGAGPNTFEGTLTVRVVCTW